MHILFVCQGNVNRSQMAATIMRALRPDIEVVSAGVMAENAGDMVSDVSEKGIEVMKELGYDMSHNKISQLEPQMVDAAERVILMGELPESAAPDYLKNSPKLETWDVPDPGYGHITHAAARDMILEKVKDLAERVGHEHK
ncbi:MAG: Protein-tyrosine-phosphatase [Candidatus Kaiserbacteria bacterium]|nr:Protein-tyrosine-phosphatase [Candidatus Kaiserbacteria bacterium]